MSKYKDMMKNGWHPETKGGSLKEQVSGMVRRDKSSKEESDHVAQPLTSLRDPASFAPPPKRTGTGLAPAPKPQSTPRKVITAPSKYADPRSTAEFEPPERITRANTDIDQQQDQGVTEPPMNRPYRSNTTGLSTNHLPPPPGRKPGTQGTTPPPPSYDSVVAGAKPAPPRLPPRLPPRTNTGSPTAALTPSNTGGSAEMLNQGAVNRLGAAGISVPALGIRPTKAPATEPSPMSPLPPRAGASSQVGDLSNRFAGLRTSSATTSQPPPSQGTSWADKQAAFKTASAFHKDPSSVSLSDARSAASTANNFRQRHGEQVAAGVQAANNVNQKYGVLDKASDAAGGGTSPLGAPGGSLPLKKKPPPPPVKKKPIGVGASYPTTNSEGDDTPPPVPLSTRPAF